MILELLVVVIVAVIIWLFIEYDPFGWDYIMHMAWEQERRENDKKFEEWYQKEVQKIKKQK